MENAIRNIYCCIELMGISMVLMGSNLLHHNIMPIIFHLIYGIGWMITILCPALFILDKIEKAERKVDIEK